MSSPYTWPYVPRLDRAYKVIGTYANGRTTWTLPSPDTLANRIVLGDGFGNLAGAVLIPISNFGGVLQVLGDFTLDYCMIGRDFASSATLSKALARVPGGPAMNRGTVTVREIVTRHAHTANYKVVSEWTGEGNVRDRTKAFVGRQDDNNLLKFQPEGVLTARHNGNAMNMDIRIVNNETRPHTIVSAEILHDFASRR